MSPLCGLIVVINSVEVLTERNTRGRRLLVLENRLTLLSIAPSQLCSSYVMVTLETVKISPPN